MMLHFFNIIFLLTLLNLISQIGCIPNIVGGVPANPSRELGLLDILGEKSKLFDTKKLYDRKPITIGSSNNPAVTVTPTTTLNVTPTQGMQTDSYLASESVQNPFDYGNTKFENLVTEDNNGNLRKGANVHCGTTHIAVSCSNRKNKKKGNDKNDERDDKELKNEEYDEGQGEEDYDN